MIEEISIATENGKDMRPTKINFSRQRISMLQQIVQPTTKTKKDYVAKFTKDYHNIEFNLNSVRQQNSVREKVCHDNRSMLLLETLS